MRNNKGVTLVELLVVIVVMGIIAGFAIPAVGNIISNANQDAVLNDAIQVENAARLYCSSNTNALFCDTGGVENGIDPLTDADLSGYVDGLDYDYAWVYYDATGEAWKVYLEDGDYFFGSTEQNAQPDSSSTGDFGLVPSTSSRADVTEATGS